jgi:glycosyltransferase involved in cell wall biosynthesis
MRIAMINNSSGWGGAEQILLHLAIRLRDRGYYVGLFLREGSATVSRLTSEGFDVWTVPRNGWRKIRGIGGVAAVVRREKFDLIHVHRNHDLLIGKIASLAANAPLLLTQHCLLGTTSSFILHFADKIVAVSRFIAADMEERFPTIVQKLEVVHNGIDLELFSDRKTDYWDDIPALKNAKPLLGVVGYFYKNQEELIELLPAIRNELPDVKLLIIGHDESKIQMLEERVKVEGVTDAVYFSGEIPHDRIGDALASLDLNISAFRREGFGLTVIEGMAVGTPFVGYNAGGYSEIVEQGVNGILVDTRDDLRDAIIRLAGSHDVLNSMGRTARNIVRERFSIFRMVSDYESIYRKMAENA